ncbi:MAG: hypothetical protein MJ078_03790 [Clostridia bacterium]|nr:hypothetical protein [Clostridia bacterium]
MKTRFTKIAAGLLALLMVAGTLGIPVSASTDKSGSYAEILASLTADSYADYLDGCQQDGAVKRDKEISLDITAFTTEGTPTDDGLLRMYSDVLYADGTPVPSFQGVFLPDTGTVTWNFTLSEEQAGLYGIRVEYYPVSDSSASIERKVYVDGKVPFDEARSVTFSKVWQYDYTEKDENGEPTFKSDASGNDIRADVVQVPVIRTYEFSDTDGFYNEPFQFYFNYSENEAVAGYHGKHSLSLVSTRETMVVKSITLFPVREIRTLADMKQEWAEKGYTAAPEGSSVYLRAETPDYVSDTAVISANDRSSALNAPIDSFSQKINVIGGTSYNTTGQWAAYTFQVEEDGIYEIAARFKQTALQGMFATRVVKLASSDGMYGYADGTPSVPYSECYYTRFNYKNGWQTGYLNNGEEELSFYFKKGVTYTLCMEVGLGKMADILNILESSLTEINNCYLEILKLTGPDPDEYGDYNFSRVMPNTLRSLAKQAAVMEEQAELLEKICK